MAHNSYWIDATQLLKNHVNNRSQRSQNLWIFSSFTKKINWIKVMSNCMLCSQNSAVKISEETMKLWKSKNHDDLSEALCIPLILCHLILFSGLLFSCLFLDKKRVWFVHFLDHNELIFVCNGNEKEIVHQIFF